MTLWKTVRNAPNYQVSANGQVRNAKTGRVLRTENEGGRKERVTLMSYGDRLRPYVGDLVTEAFHTILNQVRKDEVWRDVECAPDYQISGLGAVRKTSTMRVLTPYVNRYGKEQVTLYVGGHRITRYVEALMDEAWG